jgi:hypothetical protein
MLNQNPAASRKPPRVMASENWYKLAHAAMPWSPPVDAGDPRITSQVRVGTPIPDSGSRETALVDTSSANT